MSHSDPRQDIVVSLLLHHPPLAPPTGEVYSLEEFRDKVVGPYKLKSEERVEACHVTYKHDLFMPEPA